MRWPAEWRDASALDLLTGTPFGCLLFPSTGGFQDVIGAARRAGFTVCDSKSPLPTVQMVKGEWPGIRMAPGGGDASSGPTGAPWIDSNGWLVRLTRVRKPGRTVWVYADVPKSNEIVAPSRHLVAVADGAAHGGRWVVTPDKGMAEGLAARKPEVVDAWKNLADAVRFFQAHRDWDAWPVRATLAVISNFSGDNEFFSQEVLNLTARTNVSYGILEKDKLRPEMLRGLRAVVYPDSDPPSAELRRMLLTFVEAGGLLIAGPKWGKVAGAPATGEPHPRYAILRFGKGRVALAHQDPNDPYEAAQDAQVLLSHRYDLVRLFNGDGLGASFTVSPEGKRALVHVINYAGSAGDDPVTARVTGRHRAAKLWSLDGGETRLKMVAKEDAIEIHLPPVAVYGGIELEA